MIACVPLLFRLQSVSEETDDVGFGPGVLLQHLKDCDGRGIQQVSVPGQGIEDNGLVVKASEAQALDGSEPQGRRSIRSRIGH
jgi:hypothetical protein